VEIDNRDAAVQIRRAEAGELEARESLVVLDKEIGAAEFGRAAADANRKLAASTSDRYRSLHDRRSVSDQEFDEVQTKLAAATAELDRATAMLESAKARRNQILARIDQADAEKSSADLSMDYSHVVSPVSGIVTARTIEPGMVAAPGAPLLTVEDDAAYRLEAQVPDSIFGAIRKGAAVRIVVEAANKAEVQGRISEIVPSADPATRTTVVKVDLPKASSLRSGLFGRAFLPSGERSVISVPQELVVQHGQLTSVYVLDKKVVRQRLIKLGKSSGDRVEVVAGLQNGDLLIVEPREKLIDGMEVGQ
jgi:RND family efflux transporter MFP subunit